MLEAVVAELIPTDDTPGAVEARTAAALQQLLLEEGELAALIVRGLLALERASHARWGRSFTALASPERHELLRAVGRGLRPTGWTCTDPRPEVFWATLRGLAVSYFYGSPLGWQLAGCPGPAVDRGGYRHTLVEPIPS
ncbi:MAG TPA: gluconate 2-dehydrogenase subunit 3 family protein [Chloroflexota bacterium]|nr:gluconate 2-dehydrogenase subunit 3 family protein [Chloroflexota bacterium]